MIERKGVILCPQCGSYEVRCESCAALRAEIEDIKGFFGDVRAVAKERDELRARVALLEKGLVAVDGLIGESRGVDGLHLNGDVALWEDLRTGGVYEEWLRDYDAALDALSSKEG